MRVLPGSLHFKSLQEKITEGRNKGWRWGQVALEIRKRLREGGGKKPQTNQLNLDLIANLEEFHS